MIKLIKKQVIYSLLNGVGTLYRVPYLNDGIGAFQKNEIQDPGHKAQGEVCSEQSKEPGRGVQAESILINPGKLI